MYSNLLKCSKSVCPKGAKKRQSSGTAFQSVHQVTFHNCLQLKTLNSKSNSRKARFDRTIKFHGATSTKIEFLAKHSFCFSSAIPHFTTSRERGILYNFRSFSFPCHLQLNVCNSFESETFSDSPRWLRYLEDKIKGIFLNWSGSWEIVGKMWHGYTMSKCLPDWLSDIYVDFDLKQNCLVYSFIISQKVFINTFPSQP